MNKSNPPDMALEEIFRKLNETSDPAYLPTVSMNDLYENVYRSRPPKQVQNLPEEEREEVAVQLVELEKAKNVIRQMDAESDRRHKIAGLFCKAFERAVLLTPTEENVRIWTECTRMRPDEIEDSAKEADELAEVFSTIAAILRA